MRKKDFIKNLEKFGDEINLVITSTTQFEGINVISEDIEFIEDYDKNNRKILIIQEKNKSI